MTAQDWLCVANERSMDAETVASNRKNSAGGVYLAGYAVECSLKAYLQARGKEVPSSGRAGHDLRALWLACGFRLCDLGDNDGTRTFYIKDWKTSLRYDLAHKPDLSVDSLLGGAKSLTGWIQTRVRRGRRP